MPSRFPSKSPGQHEELLERVKEGFKDVLAGLKQKDIKIVVELDTSVQREILAVVKEIKEIVTKTGGISKAEEDILAEKLHTGGTSLEEAVKANQPKPDNQ